MKIKSKNKINKLVNIIGFQSCWWACVLGSSFNWAYLGPFMMFLFLILHFYIHSFSLNELKIVIIVGIIGTIIDSSFQVTGIIEYKDSLSSFLPPLWIISMWVGFAATINHSMDWLKNNILVGFAAGLVFGPLSYITGEKFSVINFNYSSVNPILILAIAWAFTIPILYFINEKILTTENHENKI